MTSPMTGRTIGATTSGSVSPISSGLGRSFFPGRTRMRDEKDEKKKPTKVTPPGRGRISFYNNGDSVKIRPDFKLESVERARLIVTENAWLKSLRKMFTGRSTASPRPPARSAAPTNTAVTAGSVTSKLKPKQSFGVPQLSPEEKKQWRPGKSTPIGVDAAGNLTGDDDYASVGSALHQSGAWGQDAPHVEVPDSPETSKASSSMSVDQSKVSTATPAKSLGNSSMTVMPSRTPMRSKAPSGETFVRSKSKSAHNDYIPPED